MMRRDKKETARAEEARGDLFTGCPGQSEDGRVSFGSYSEKPVEKSDIYINVNPNVSPDETQTDDDISTTTATMAAASVDNFYSDSERLSGRIDRQRGPYDAVEVNIDDCGAQARAL